MEDVSNRYMPLFSTERESDTVKRVDISKYHSLKSPFAEKDESEINLPLYIVSLIEHKTKVEYNVIMQVLRSACRSGYSAGSQVPAGPAA